MTRKYRIYSRLIRDILDKIWPIFLQFDLYPDHKTYRLIEPNLNDQWFRAYTLVFWSLKNYEFWTIFSIQLVRGSTYARVYTVVILKSYFNCKTDICYIFCFWAWPICNNCIVFVCYKVRKLNSKHRKTKINGVW